MGGKVSSKMAAPVGRIIQVRLRKWPLNCTTATFATQVVRPHSPLIKFPDRHGIPKPNALEALKALAVDLPQQTVLSPPPPPPPPAVAPSPPAVAPPPISRPLPPASRLPGTPDTLASIQSLPQRYRRRVMEAEEMDYIQRGGPE